MINHIFFNLGLALVWCLLQADLSLKGFVVGYGLGALLMYVFSRFFDEAIYFRKLWLSLKLVAFFLKELVVANLGVAWLVIRPRLRVRPGIIAFPLELESDLEITLLANMITLTPGTLSVDLSPDRKTLYIHTLDIEDPEEEKRKIRQGFERYLKEILQ